VNICHRNSRGKLNERLSHGETHAKRRLMEHTSFSNFVSHTSFSNLADFYGKCDIPYMDAMGLGGKNVESQVLAFFPDLASETIKSPKVNHVILSGEQAEVFSVILLSTIISTGPCFSTCQNIPKLPSYNHPRTNM